MQQPLLAEPGWAVVQGASRGIGAALTAALLERSEVSGVIATSRAPERSEELLRLAQQHGERLHTLPLDVEDERSIAAAAEQVQAHCGRDLRILLNVAGLLHEGQQQPEKRWEDLTAAHLARAFCVNATGPVLVARHLLPAFARRGRTLIASLSARVGSISDNRLGGWYAYRASKAAQNMLTRTLSIELSRRLPECVCVGLHPGTVETDLSAPFRRGSGSAQRFAPHQAAAHLLEVLAGLDTARSGRCFAWDGQEIAP